MCPGHAWQKCARLNNEHDAFSAREICNRIVRSCNKSADKSVKRSCAAELRCIFRYFWNNYSSRVAYDRPICQVSHFIHRFMKKEQGPKAEVPGPKGKVPGRMITNGTQDFNRRVLCLLHPAAMRTIAVETAAERSQSSRDAHSLLRLQLSGVQLRGESWTGRKVNQSQRRVLYLLTL